MKCGMGKGGGARERGELGVGSRASGIGANGEKGVKGGFVEFFIFLFLSPLPLTSSILIP